MLRIASSKLEVEILPEVGGKIGQIRDHEVKRALLISPRKPYCTIPLEGDWLQHDTSGMDDCFPNVAACIYPDAPWNGTPLPDLGEWTHGEWQIAAHSGHAATLTRTGIAIPYVASKTVRLADERTLELVYCVENQSRSPFRYLWSAHPLIEVPDAFELFLPSGPIALTTFPPDEKSTTWPHWKSIDLSREWIPHGTTLKIFLTGFSEGWCALRLPTHTLHFSFDARELPALGIWFNNFGFPRNPAQPFRCIAIEPCTTASDLLGQPEPVTYPSIAPGASARWSLRLQVKPNSSSET